VTKLDGQWLDHEVDGNPGDWGVLSERGTFSGLISPSGELRPFAFTYEEAMDCEREGWGKACLIPDCFPEARRLRKRNWE